MKSASDVSQMIAKATLKKERGWTDSLIARFLGEPDKTRPNPHYRTNGAPMRLFALKRVEGGICSGPSGRFGLRE